MDPSRYAGGGDDGEGEKRTIAEEEEEEGEAEFSRTANAEIGEGQQKDSREKKKKKKKKTNGATEDGGGEGEEDEAGEEGGDTTTKKKKKSKKSKKRDKNLKRPRAPLKRERSTFFPADEGEASDVLMLNKDDILSDKFERKMRNLNQLRRSSVVSGMKELWMEDLPHPQRSVSAASWESRDMPTGYAGEASRDELEKELYQCLSAKTALVLPFHWGDNQKSITQWIDRLLKRTVVDKDSGRRVKLWESDFMLPFEVSELSAHFRQIVGWNETVKRFLHEQQQQQQRQQTKPRPHGTGDSLGDIAQSIHQHSEFTPRPDELVGETRAEKEERRKDRMHRRMNKQMTQKKAGGAGGSRARQQGDGKNRRGRHDEHDRTTTEEGETEEDSDERDDGPNRNCLLMDEGGDIEAEQDEEEEVDSIANDLEVWKCQRMKLTRKAREILFPNPCIWASSGDAVPSPVQARDEERRRHMASGQASGSGSDSSDYSTSESDTASNSSGDESSTIPRIPPPPGGAEGGRPHLVQHTVSEPNLAVPPTGAPVQELLFHEPMTPPVRKASVPSLPTSWEDYALAGSAPAAVGLAPPELPQGSTVLSKCNNKIGFEVEMDSVELVMYPLGCGLLVFHLNWMPEKLKDVPLTLDELRTWLFLVKFRHKVKKVFLGWTLGMEAALIAHGLSDGTDKKKAEMGPFMPAHLRSLGRLGNSIYGDELLSLCTIGNWLLQLPHEDPTAPIRRISYGACANHHTTVVLDREPDEADLKEYLFHLTRAFGQRNRPPPPGVAERQRLDHVLVHRLNRYIGVSREGTVAMSWPTDTANQHFEAHTWPKLFQGVYLILCLHARGEASVLSELSNLSASAAEHLRLESLMEGETLEKLEKDRTYLRYLAVLLIKYSLGMSSDDCGGLSEYSNFFSTMRRVLRIPETRQEIREEIHDVLGIVEGGYLEEQRRQLQEEKRAQKKKERERYKSDRDKDAQKRRIEILLSIIGAITLPLVLVSGIWGMNVHDLPDLSFWPLLGVTSGLSIIFLGVLLGWLFFLSPRPASSPRRGGKSGSGIGEKTNSNGYTSLASTAPASPRSSLEVDRTMSSFETGTTSERSLASAFAALSGINKRDNRPGELHHYDYLTPSRSRISVNTSTPRVSFNLPRSNGNGNGNGNGAEHKHDLYNNPW